MMFADPMLNPIVVHVLDLVCRFAFEFGLAEVLDEGADFLAQQ